ncbi:hypothetical protein EUX98_g9366 [Antrodiella citrinella]|uniref:Copper transport protein n=1 Tax=Antrodiella citrinella TaxID=2447956 RepID=A0A4S4LW57_9APHY|nr:hypothetical protein EUX98_g9366 [Antrodiella citrinella]
MALLHTMLALLIVAPLVLAHGNGMDMSMDDAMSLTTGRMLTYLHFTSGDNLWFLGWVPKSSGAMVGACVGMLLLGILDRWIAACRAVMEMHWAKRGLILEVNRRNAKGLPVATPTSERFSTTTSGQFVNALTMRTVSPFVFWHDFTRGFMYFGQASLQFAFMLAIMTFQLGFILSLVVGLGIGETLFGRYASHAVHLV